MGGSGGRRRTGYHGRGSANGSVHSQRLIGTHQAGCSPLRCRWEAQGCPAGDPGRRKLEGAAGAGVEGGGVAVQGATVGLGVAGRVATAGLAVEGCTAHTQQGELPSFSALAYL